ncbi:SurA N-terminal domain-containing protein [Blastochloris viridis]|nr:SurA N-terminal domain-containing protein [Blastochloris viridis]
MSSLLAVWRTKVRIVCLGAAVMAGACALASPASAQVVALVNGEPITTLDVAHRTRLLTLINQGRTPGRKDVVEELVDERLKLREAAKFGAVPADSEVDTAFANVAGRARMSADQFSQMLNAQGSNARSFKNRLRADIAWNGLVRARYKVVAQVGDKDVAVALDARKQSGAKQMTEYTLRQVVFVVPRGASDAVIDTRRREAEALRSRFQGCDEGIAAARGLREVVVRAPIRKTSADLTPALRDLFNNTPDGKAAAPERTEAGVELVAVCSRRDLAGQTVAHNEIRQELVSERLQTQAQRYIAELRRAALIEYR